MVPKYFHLFSTFTSMFPYYFCSCAATYPQFMKHSLSLMSLFQCTASSFNAFNWFCKPAEVSSAVLLPLVLAALHVHLFCWIQEPVHLWRKQNNCGLHRQPCFTSLGQLKNWDNTDISLRQATSVTSLQWSLVCLLVGCLTFQQHASVSQGRICTDNFTCCHTEIEAADQTFHLTRSQYTDTGPTSPRADPITPGAWQGSHGSANF